MDLNISLAPEILFELGGLEVTNTFFWMILILVFLGGVSILLRLVLSLRPGRLQNLFEFAIEGAYDFVYSVVGDSKRAKRIFPLFFSLLIFILIANLIPFLVPGGSAISFNNGQEYVPLFRSVMSEYGLVLVLTLMVVVIIQVSALVANGFKGYLGNFLRLTSIWQFFKALFQGHFRIGLLFQGGLDLFLGFMELLSEFMRIISMSFRLFGNIFAGEVLMTVILALMPFFLPLPFMFLGVLSAVIQAFVFAMLTLIALSMVTQKEEVED